MTTSAAPIDPVALFNRLSQVFGRSYRPERLVASSAERALCLAWDMILKRRVALRVHLLPEVPGRDWFLRESEVLARVDHPGFRRVYAAGAEQELVYRVSNWIEGESLAEATARSPRPIPDVMTLARDLLSAVEHAHGRGVIVRRIVPGTVLLNLAGRATIIDLRFSNPCLDVVVSSDDRVSLPFLPPETRGGQPGDPSSDVYVVGALLYYAATGSPPALEPETIVAPVVLRPVVPVAVNSVIQRALLARPSDRYLTAVEMLDDLQQYAGAWDEPGSEPLPPPAHAGPIDAEAARRWEARLRRALGDDYELLSDLGSGSFGSVYRVRDLRLEREVALKVLHPELTVDPAVVERFRREAQLAAGLQHPNIVYIYGIHGRAGLLWYTMEWIRGPSLGGLVERDGQLPVDRVVAMLDEALDALEHAHGRGLVHRDIKPENLLIDPSERVLLTDFGLALALRGQAGAGGATSRSGTPQFAAPEQLLGEQVDRRTDVCSLALCAYYALLGRLPFEAGTPEAVIARQLAGKLPPIGPERPDVTPELEAVLRRAADPEPARRYATAPAFRDAIARAVRPPSQHGD